MVETAGGSVLTLRQNILGFGRDIRRSKFVWDVFTLSSGTAVSQAIMIGILPILSRLYSPTEFGVFTLYVSITTLASVFASMGFESMIMLSRSDRAAAQLIWLIFAISLGAAIVAFVVALLFRHSIANALGVPEIAPWLFAVPVSLAVTGIYQALRYWTIRRQCFSEVSKGMVARAAGFSLVASLSKFSIPALLSGGGLILGHIVGNLLNVLVLLRNLVKNDRDIIGSTSRKRVVAGAKRHGPIAATLSVSFLIGKIASSLPHYMLATFFGSTALGFYGIAERVIGAPAQLIAEAIGDVYRQRASVLHRERGRFDRLTIKTLIATTSLAIIPYTVGIIYAPEIFSILFGAPWREAGSYASILLVGGFFSFVITPIDKAAVIVGAKKYLIYWVLVRCLLKLGLFALLAFGMIGIYSFLWSLVAIRITMYLIEFVFCYIYARTGAPIYE